MTKVPCAFAVLGLSLALLLLATRLQPGDKPIVWLAGLPSPGTGEAHPVPTRRSFAALEALGQSLLARGVPSTWITDREVPLEVTASSVDLNPSSFFVGVRSLDHDPQCVALHVPSGPATPDANPMGHKPADLEEAIRYADAVERAALSQRAAARIESLVPTCPVPPDEWVKSFLTASRGPTIVVEFRSADGGGTRDSERPAPTNILHGVSEAIARYFREAPHNEWMHQTKRFD